MNIDMNARNAKLCQSYYYRLNRKFYYFALMFAQHMKRALFQLKSR